jgi:hypothetical protein
MSWTREAEPSFTPNGKIQSVEDGLTALENWLNSQLSNPEDPQSGKP